MPGRHIPHRSPPPAILDRSEEYAKCCRSCRESLVTFALQKKASRGTRQIFPSTHYNIRHTELDSVFVPVEQVRLSIPLLGLGRFPRKRKCIFPRRVFLFRRRMYRPTLAREI